jgi:MYXO-CTERM domain-containing protein
VPDASPPPVEAAAPTNDGGGCAFAPGAGTPVSFGVALGLLLLGAIAARRRTDD